MLPNSLRLSRSGFEQLKGLRRLHSPHFSLSYGISPERGGSAVIVPKKTIKGAVTRHLLKRRIRAILKPFSTTTRILIVTAKKNSDTLSFAQIQHELSGLLSSIL